MKIFRNPLFYTNIILGVLLILLLATDSQAKFSSLIRNAIAQVGSAITGNGSVIRMARFAGAVPGAPSTQIGDSIVYDTGTRVGINTAAPAGVLDVSGSEDTLFRLTRQGGANPSIFRQGLDNKLVARNNGIDTLTLDTGRVGIGTVNAPGSLTLRNGITDPIIVLRGRSTDGAAAIRWYPNNETLNVTIANMVGGNSGLFFSTGGVAPSTPAVERMRIDAAGNVGIGTNNPQATLHVNGTMILAPQTNAPASPVNGQIWLCANPSC